MLRGYLTLVTMTLLWGMSRPCSRFEFRCKNNKCISMERLCNGIADCQDESDEPPECTRKTYFLKKMKRLNINSFLACNTTYYGEVGKTYELEVKRPNEHQLPFLCFLNFTAGGGALGELVQVYILISFISAKTLISIVVADI